MSALLTIALSVLLFFAVNDRLDPKGDIERIWRDTLMVIADEPQIIRTRYTEFPSKFVLHCHILDHEDQGMMQAVEIVPESYVL